MSSLAVAPNKVGSLEGQEHKGCPGRRPRSLVWYTCRQDLDLELWAGKCTERPARSRSTAGFDALKVAAVAAAAGPWGVHMRSGGHRRIAAGDMLEDALAGLLQRQALS